MRLEFFNNVGEPILPTEIEMKSEIPPESAFKVTQEQTTQTIGKRAPSNNNFRANIKIEGNALVIQGSLNYAGEITSVYQFKLQSLTTGDNKYIYFHYQN